MEISRRRVAAYALIAVIVLGAGVAVAAHIAGTVAVSDGVSLQAPDGMNATLTGATDANLEEPFPTSGTVEWTTEAGNITFFSSGAANATVHKDDITGTWTNITAIDGDPNAITINPEDKAQVIVGQEIVAVDFTGGMSADDGSVDFVYESPGGAGRLTVTGLPANADLYAIDDSTGNILDQADSNGGGSVTFNALDSGTHTVVIQQDVNDAPVLSNPDPVGPQTSTVSTFEVDVNDTNFDQGDTVTAELFVEGTSRGTDSLSSNGTASVNHNVDLGKSIEYSWVATDDFGGQTIINETLTTPVNVTFREEHNASKIITGADATITLYSTDAEIVVERTDSDDDGNISLAGLPDKEFVAVAQTDDHYTRRVYIESIYEQQSIFLLNQTEVPGDRAINTTFLFEDRTGDFDPEDSTLRVQRALDVNNDDNFTWMTVAGDFWGAASEFPFTGEENARYRLIVENDAGDRRVLGTHIPVEDGTKTIINGEIRFEAENATGRYFDANLSQSKEDIQILYQDPTNGTGDIRIRIWELGNESNEIHDQNYTNSPYGRLFTTVDLTSEQAGKSWVVRYDATHDEDGDVAGQIPVGAGIDVSLPADPWLLAAFGVIGLTMIGTLYGPRTYLIGSWVLVISAAGMTAFGILAVPWPGIVVAVAIAAGGTFYKEALP